MRVTEAFQTLPNFILLLVLVAVFGSTITTVTVAHRPRLLAGARRG